MLKQTLVLLGIVLIFGILVPWYKGFVFLQPWFLAAYAAMALLFVAPAAADFWGAIPSPPSTGEILARLFAIVGYAWGIVVVMLIAAMVTLNLAFWRGQVLMPPTMLMASLLVFSLTASTLVATLCAVLARRLSARAVKSLIRLIFLVVLLLVAFGSRFLPEAWQITVSDYGTRRAMTRLGWEASVVCAVVGAVLLAVLVRGGGVPEQEATP